MSVRRMLFVVGALVLLAPLLATTAPRAAAACGPDYAFVAARGSGQDETSADKYMGNEMNDVFSRLKAKVDAVGRTIEPHGVRYPAVAVYGGFRDTATGIAKAFHVGAGYDSSVDRGIELTRSTIRGIANNCSTTKIIVGGYSQGAEAVAEAVAGLDSSTRKRIVASAYFGDPMFNAEDTTAALGDYEPSHHGAFAPRARWSTVLGSPVFSYCHDGDPICGLTKRVGKVPFTDKTLYVRDVAHIVKKSGTNVFAQHTNYVARSRTQDAAQRIADVLGIKVPATKPKVPVDMVFVIDSTGSMGGVLDRVADNVVALTRVVAAGSSDFRFALVDYKDIRSEDSAYQSRLAVPFTSSASRFESGVRGIVAEGGGDREESVYSGVMRGLELPWRASALKSVIVIGDAPGKDPEPGTGYRRTDVVNKAYSVGVIPPPTPMAAARSVRSVSLAQDSKDTAQIYSVTVGDDEETRDFLSPLSDATGGTVTSSEDSDEFVEDLEDAVSEASAAPVAAVTGPSEATAGKPLLLSAAGTVFDIDDEVVGYDWNFGGDTPSGQWEKSTDDSLVEHTYEEPGTYTVAVRARTASGLSGLATTTVTVEKPVDARPAVPTDLVAAGSDGAVKLTWSASDRADYYRVLDESGETVAAITGDRETVTFVDGGLANGVTKAYRVVATNGSGESAPSDLRSATPAAPRASNVTAPSVTGSPVVGATLAASDGEWTPDHDVTFSYQWLRGTAAVKGATTRTYRVGRSDLGRRLSVLVTATAAGSEPTRKSSLATPVVRAVSKLKARTRVSSRRVVVTAAVSTDPRARATGRIKVTVGASSWSSSIRAGKATVRTKRLKPGTYSVVVSYSGSTSAAPTKVVRKVRVR